jgi:hypothetical protein
MPSALTVMGEVAGSAIAFSGLILVFLGAISTGFDGYEKQEQITVMSRYQRRAWLAFVGFVLSLLAAVLSLVAKWFSIESAAIGALILLFVALVWVVFIAYLEVRDIK